MNDGGPAFACAAENGHQAGMSLRDWFAGMALTGIVNMPIAIKELAKDKGIGSDVMTAKIAYSFADAMLAAREAPRG